MLSFLNPCSLFTAAIVLIAFQTISVSCNYEMFNNVVKVKINQKYFHNFHKGLPVRTDSFL